MPRLVVYGAGGYGQELVWLADDITATGCTAWEMLGYIDDDPALRGEERYGRPVIGALDEFAKDAGSLTDVYFVIGVGRPSLRRQIAETVARQTPWLAPATLVHPSAIIARHVTLHEGCIVGAGCVIGPYAELRQHVALNVHVGVGHHATIGSFSMLLPGARISGSCSIGDAVAIGSNAVVTPGVSVGNNATVAAGALVLRNVAEHATAFGNPARSFNPRSKKP